MVKETESKNNITCPKCYNALVKRLEDGSMYLRCSSIDCDYKKFVGKKQKSKEEKQKELIQKMESDMVEAKKEINSKENISNLKRKGTNYIKKNGYRLIEKLSKKEKWKTIELQEIFLNKPHIIQKLVDNKILKQLESLDCYTFDPDALKNFLYLVNTGKVDDIYTIELEKWLESFDGCLSYFAFYYKFSVFDFPSECIEVYLGNILQLCVNYSKEIDFWKKFNYIPGIALYYAKILGLYNLVIEENLSDIEKDDNLKNIIETIKILESSLIKEDYYEIKNHFWNCPIYKCEKCEGNLYNIICNKIEDIRKKVMEKYKDSYVKLNEIINYEGSELSELSEQLEKFQESVLYKNISIDKPLWPSTSNKNLKDYIPTMIEAYYRGVMWEIYKFISPKKILSIVRNNKIDLSENIFCVFRKIIEPIVGLNYEKAELSKPFEINEDIFKNYHNKTNRN